jgi:5-methylthioribose kinase
MSLRERIQEDTKTAMRAGEKTRLKLLRTLAAAVKQREVDERTTLDDTGITAVIEKMIVGRMNKFFEEVTLLKQKFVTNAETLVHGDLHTGSVMVTPEDTRVIDPEFAFYGPIAFDVGMLLGNFWTAYFSQSGHESGGSREEMRTYLLGVCEEVWQVFTDEFTRLWHSERNGMLYPRSLYEDQGDELGAHQALDRTLVEIWRDMLGYAGVEMHRRILGLAHNAEFETIEDADLRARCEAKALAMGRHLAVNRHGIHSMSQVNILARRIEERFLP